MAELAVYDNDPTLYLFTSLTAGSSHIITATSRIETILRANKVPFKGVDTATDELAKKLFQRRARGKKLPLLVKEGFVIADLDQVEEWNEYDELKEALGAPAVPAPAIATPLAASKAPAASAAVGAAPGKENAPTQTPAQNLAIRQLGAEAASVAASKKHTPAHISTTNPLLTAKASPSAASTPGKPAAASPGGILSPKSIPLPSTPANVGKGAAGLKSPTGESRGGKVESSGKEEIKRDEAQTAPAEASSSEEEDDDDEDEDEDEEEEEEEEEEQKKAPTANAPVKEAVKTEAKPSVKEEDEEDEDEEDDDDDDEEEESEEDEKKPTSTQQPAKDAVKPDAKTDVKPTANPSAKEDDDDEDEGDDDEEDSSEESEDEPVKDATIKPTAKPSVKDTEKEQPTPAQDAKAADKAGVSVED